MKFGIAISQEVADHVVQDQPMAVAMFIGWVLELPVILAQMIMMVQQLQRQHQQVHVVITMAHVLMVIPKQNVMQGLKELGTHLIIAQLELVQQLQRQRQLVHVVSITEHVLMVIPKQNVTHEPPQHGMVQIIVPHELAQLQPQHQPALVVIITDHVLMEIRKRHVMQEQRGHGMGQLIVQLEHAIQQQHHQHVAATVFTCGTDRLGAYPPTLVLAPAHHQEAQDHSQVMFNQELALKI